MQNEFKCSKCGNETFLEAENEYEKTIICKKCAEVYIVETKKARPQTHVLKCLYCGSENIKKIGTLNRASSVVLFGIASKKIGKQWHCNNCGSDF